MDPRLRAAAGLGVAGIGHLAYAGLSLLGGSPGLFQAGMVLVAAGLLVASAGAAAMVQRGPGLLSGGLGLAAAGGVVVLTYFLGRPSPYGLGMGLVAVGLVQAAWFAMLWASEGTSGAPRRAGPTRLSLAVGAAGSLVVAALNVANANPDWLSVNVAVMAGFAVAARALPGPAETS